MSNKFNSNILCIDVESTCWELPEVQGLNEISEIIEIGVTVVDSKKLEIINTDSIIVKPQRSKISKFCTKLTTLTQEKVDQGIFYQDSINLLKRRYDSENRTMLSWGDYDRKMFERNCRDYDVRYPFGPRHINLKNTFTVLMGLDHEPSVEAALKLLGMNFEGTQHRGDDDSKNIAKIFIHTLKKFRDI